MEAFINETEPCILIAEHTLTQGMEFDAVLLLQTPKSNVNTAGFSCRNRYLRAKYKLAVIDIVKEEQQAEGKKRLLELHPRLSYIKQDKEIQKLQRKWYP